jgi:hypothetical protein
MFKFHKKKDDIKSNCNPLKLIVKIILTEMKKRELCFGNIKKENTFAVPIIVRTYK